MQRINRWLAGLKIAHKLILSSVVFALPIAVLLYYATVQYQRQIRTCQTELAGTTLLKVCPGLIHDLYDFEMQATLGSARDGGQQSRSRIQNAVSILRQGKHVQAKSLMDRLDSLENRLTDSSAAANLSEQASLAGQMVETSVQLVPILLDDSLLTLDSELDTYYLMNVTGPLLLQSQTALAEARSVAVQAKAQGRRLDARDLSSIQEQCGALSNTIFPRMRYSLDTALREDKRLHEADSSFQKDVPPLFEKYFSAASQLSAAARNDADLTPDRFIQMASAAEEVGVSLGETSVRELRGLLSRRIAEERHSRSAALLLTLICLGVAAGVMTIITHNITGPLNRVVRLTADIAAGKVNQAFGRIKSGEFREFMANDGAAGRCRTRDEVWRLMRTVSVMTENLNGLLSKVTEACNLVAGTATQMAEAMDQVESAISEQAASTNEVSATSKEIYATVQEFSQTMGSVMKMASDAARTASGSVENLNGIRDAIDELIGSSAMLIGSFESINQKTANIDKVITTITKVANSTNLLSLNAAIEAEKAGEKAGGFSVVALEIRRLADQTAVAALDIERQIRETQQAVQEGVSKVESNAEQTRTSSLAINELSSGLEQVIEGTAKLGPRFEAVNSGMQVQSQGAGQIAEAMVHLRDAATQTKASLDEFRAVTDVLSGAVSDLQGEVGRFSVAS